MTGKERWSEKRGGRKIKVVGKERCPEREVVGKERCPEKRGVRKREVSGLERCPIREVSGL